MKPYLRWGAVIALVVLVGWLLALGSKPEPPAPPVDFPRELRGPEKEREIARRTLAPPKAAEPPHAQRPRDPLLAAIGGSSAVVLEVNALRNSPIGELWLKCLRASDGGELDLLRSKLGIDPVNRVDRLVFGPDDMVVTGQFQDVRWDQLLAGQSPTRYGDQGSYYQVVMDGGMPMVATRWGDQIFSIDWSVDGAKARIDRIEGRGASPPPLLGEAQTYGDAYGVVEPALLVDFLSDVLPDKGALQSRLLSAATSLEFHLDASQDLALTAEVHGKDPAALNDLAHSLEAAFNLWRRYAQTHHEPELAALLDQAKVTPGTGTFSVQLALPLAILRDKLADCGQRR
jgi:hypothetical protein